MNIPPILLTELADRVERLTGPCRETDALVWWHVERAKAERIYWNAAPGKPYPLEGEMPHGMGRLAVTRFAPAYTASLDAAITLVPEGHAISVEWSSRYPGTAWLYPPDNTNDIQFQAEGATPALALTAASLRARAALENSHG